ncbi:MAG: hypothetical protein K1X71_17840 [Pirellulales bacterium]|nr:hypothetical protein [Pirellulales bacterium]
MIQLNPYESPRPLNFQQPSTVLQGASRLARAAVLGAVGYCVYFASVFAFSRMDSSISWEAASWTAGGVAAFAFALSEIFCADLWALRTSLLRRLMLSITATIVSCLAADPIAALAGVELRHHRELLVLPWLAIALPVLPFSC